MTQKQYLAQSRRLLSNLSLLPEFSRLPQPTDARRLHSQIFRKNSKILSSLENLLFRAECNTPLAEKTSRKSQTSIASQASTRTPFPRMDPLYQIKKPKHSKRVRLSKMAIARRPRRRRTLRPSTGVLTRNLPSKAALT